LALRVKRNLKGNLENIVAIDSEEVKSWLLEYKKADDKKKKKQLKNLIVHVHISLVKKIAQGLARRQTDPIEDIIQVGCMGLIKAIDQYDVSFGASFKTYATYRITGEIRHYLRDKSSMIRAPRELIELSIRMNNIVERLKTKLGRPPTELEIADEIQIPVKRISEVFEVDRRKQLISLDQIVSASENEQTLIEKLVDDKYQDSMQFQEEKIMLSDAVELLPDYLKEVIEMNFFQDMNQSEIAKKVGVSQMQISRRIKKATNELFRIITSGDEARVSQLRSKVNNADM
jgi:RNA polymerase sigma-B factor